ncbi:MAG: trypsin-like peptidase domain-containing protein [Planctomycetes bacterium]|nr:trypsin-like peptidase domain-containing protein [Planctomycetota bacterium]
MPQIRGAPIPRYLARRAPWAGVAGLALASLQASPATAQQLPPEVLQRVKAAVAYVTVQSREGGSCGSAFLFRAADGHGFLLTCEHVVADVPTAEVVFGSGSRAERKFEARVLVADPSRDLACLRIEGEGLASPLPIEGRTSVRETEVVYAVGFPFGAALSASGRNPEVTITRGSVASIRRDEHERVATVQLSGDVNPGHSGGPVINVRGEVVGVTRAKIGGTSTAFAVPPESIRAFLSGRVTGVSTTVGETTPATAKIAVVAELMDPLGGLASASFLVAKKGPGPRGAVKQTPDGAYEKADPHMLEIPLAIDADRVAARGIWQPSRAPGDGEAVSYVYQGCYVSGEGGTRFTEPIETEVFFGQKPSGGAGTGAGSGVAAGVELGACDELTATATLALSSVIGDAFLTPDGNTLFALDLSEARVCKVSTSSMTVLQAVSIPDHPIAMAMSPDATKLFVVSRTLGVAVDAKSHVATPRPSGALRVLDARSMRIASVFPLEQSPYDVEATDQGLALVSFLDSSHPCLIDTRRKVVEEWFAAVDEGRFESGSRLRLHPDQSRIYALRPDRSPPSLRCIRLAPPAKDRPLVQPCGDPALYVMGDCFEILPDGRYLLGNRGAVLRLSPDPASDMRGAGRIRPFVAAVAAKGSPFVFLSTEEGELLEVSVEDLEVRRTFRVDRLCTRLLLDLPRRMLYAVACRTVAKTQPYPRPTESPSAGRLGVGDLVKYAFGKQPR